MSDRDVRDTDGGSFADDAGRQPICACLIREKDHTNPHYVLHQERLVDRLELLLEGIRQYKRTLRKLSAGEGRGGAGWPDDPEALASFCRRQIARDETRIAALEHVIDWKALADWMAHTKDA